MVTVEETHDETHEIKAGTKTSIMNKAKKQESQNITNREIKTSRTIKANSNTKNPKPKSSLEVAKPERIILKHRLNRLSPYTNVSYNNGKNVYTGRIQATALH